METKHKLTCAHMPSSQLRAKTSSQTPKETAYVSSDPSVRAVMIFWQDPLSATGRKLMRLITKKRSTARLRRCTATARKRDKTIETRERKYIAREGTVGIRPKKVSNVLYLPS